MSAAAEPLFVRLAGLHAEGLEADEEILRDALASGTPCLQRLALEMTDGVSAGLVPLVVELAASDDPLVALAAVEVLRTGDGEAWAEALIRALRHPLTAVRLAALSALRDRRIDAALPALVDALSDTEPVVRKEAVIALARYRSNGLTAVVLRRVDDAEAPVREAALLAVAEIGDRSCLRTIRRATSDAEWQVRKAAAIALGKFQQAEARSALISLLGDEAWEVVREALLSLAAGGLPFIEATVRLVEFPISDVRIALARSAGGSGDVRWIEEIQRLRDDPDTGVTKAARAAIDQLTPEPRP
jgi:HEAT repeat protein